MVPTLNFCPLRDFTKNPSKSPTWRETLFVLGGELFILMEFQGRFCWGPIVDAKVPPPE